MTSPPQAQPATVVANPGHLTWMPHTAAALARAGMLRAYFAPIATTARDLALAERLPGALGRLVASELGRRRVPDDIPSERVHRAAVVSELGTVAAKRLRLPDRLTRALPDRRDWRFDAGVARRLDESDRTAFLAYGAALETARAARGLGIQTFLDYPVSHYRFAETVLQEELRRQPSFAPTMQFHEVPPRRRKRLDAEIATVDYMLALSRFHKQTFVDAGVDDSRVVVNPFGVDLDRFRPVPRHPDGVFRVLFAGQLTQRKGLSYLIDGFRQAGIAEGELLLVGRPYRTAAPWAGQPGLRHIDMVPPWEVPALYTSADVFVLPSLIEAPPARVVLEAMACGLPVIVTPNAAGEDIVSDEVDGYMVPIRDADAIAERLRFLHRNPQERERIGRAARRRAQDFTWEGYGERMVSLAKRAG